MHLIEDFMSAFHAGASKWKARSNLNDTSIVIEVVNSGGYLFSDDQNNAIASLVDELMKKYQIHPTNIIAHYDIAPGRKFDPSGYFDWQNLYNKLGIFRGLYNSQLEEREKSKTLLGYNTIKFDKNFHKKTRNLQLKLMKYGYDIKNTGLYDLQTKNVVEAFNRHFCPEVFQKEKVINMQVEQIPENQMWYAISEEKLNFLLSQA